MSDVKFSTSDIIFRLSTSNLTSLSYVATEYMSGFLFAIVRSFCHVLKETKRRIVQMRPIENFPLHGFYASTLANVAFCSMNSRRGPTSSPISMENM